MATNTLTLGLPRSSFDNLTIEDHIKSMLDKLEQMRQTKDEAHSISGKQYKQPMKIEIKTLEFWRSIISECLATFFFVFIVSGAGLLKNFDSTIVITTALATGFSMATLNFCFGHISGAHINPAVSIAFAVTKKISPLRAGMFVLAQCGGGIAGAALLYGVKLPGNNIWMPQLGSWERFGLEFTLTFVIVFVHCVAAERAFFNNGCLLIGAAYTCCSLVDVPMLNPARALGPAFVTNKLWDNQWVYWFGPICGGLVSAIIYEFIFNSKRHKRRSKDSIDGDSSSIQSDDENYDDKFRPAAYRPVAHGSVASPNGNYCPSVASAYSSPSKFDRVDSVYGGGRSIFKSQQQQNGNSEAIYSGSRSLYNAKVADNGIYGGTKSMYTKSPPLTRANLNRSQSVYTKQNPRDVLPPPGPLIPAQSLYPIGNTGFLNTNMREFGSPDGNFITGVKNTEGEVVKVNFNQNTMNFLAGRGSRSHHDLHEPERPSFNVGHNALNQNVQNQNRQNLKPDKTENIYGVRNSPTGGIYPGSEPKKPEEENPRTSRTAAYVRSVQNSHKPRENYDVVPNGVREYKPNRSETSDYGSNQSETSFNRVENLNERTVYGSSRSEKDSEGLKKQDRPQHPLPPHNLPPIPYQQQRNKPMGAPSCMIGLNQPITTPNHNVANISNGPMNVNHNSNGPININPMGGVIGPIGLSHLSAQNPRQSPLSSVSSSSFSRNSPNPPY